MPNKVEVFTQELDKCFTILRQQLVIIKHMKDILSSEDFQTHKIQELDDLTTEINNNLNELSSINREQYDTLSENISVVERGLERVDDELSNIHNIVGEGSLRLQGEPNIALETANVTYNIEATEDDGLYIYPFDGNQLGYIQYHNKGDDTYALKLSFDSNELAYMKVSSYSMHHACDDGSFTYKFISTEMNVDMDIGITTNAIDIRGSGDTSYLTFGAKDTPYSCSLTALGGYSELAFGGETLSAYLNYEEVDGIEAILTIFSDSLIYLNANNIDIGNSNTKHIKLNGSSVRINNADLIKGVLVQDSDVEISSYIYNQIDSVRKIIDDNDRVYTLIRETQEIFKFVWYEPGTNNYVNCIIYRNPEPSGKHQITFTGTGL